MEGNIVTVLKADKIINIPEDDLRKGDLLLLQAGDLVAADVKLIEAVGLEVDEWELTGEIVPAEKRVGREDVFIHRGSRIAKRVSKALINELTDLLALIRGARRIRWVRFSILLRVAVLISVFLGLYAWMLNRM